MVSATDARKRALVSLLKLFASAYNIALQLTRDSTDADVRKAYRAVSKKVHPDKGGKTEDQEKLNLAFGTWEDALKEVAGKRGRPSGKAKPASPNPGNAVLAATPSKEERMAKGFRVQSVGLLLTYQKFRELAVWERFVAFVGSFLEARGVRYWCATLETNEDGTYHLHAMLQFWKEGNRSTLDFLFEGVAPNGRPNDLLGEGWGGRRYQQSLDRGFFYVFANKKNRTSQPSS